MSVGYPPFVPPKNPEKSNNSKSSESESFIGDTLNETMQLIKTYEPNYENLDNALADLLKYHSLFFPKSRKFFSYIICNEIIKTYSKTLTF